MAYITIRRRVTHFLEDLGEGNGVELNELLVMVSHARRAPIRRYAHLQFVEIISKLLEAFFEGDEACRYLGGGGTSSLHDFLLVQESFEAELELRGLQPPFLRQPVVEQTSASF